MSVSGNMPAGSQEANVLRTYVETLLDLPWKKMSRTMTTSNMPRGYSTRITTGWSR